MTDLYTHSMRIGLFLRMALETARKAGELTAKAELRLDLQPTVVCLTPNVAIVLVPLGDMCAAGGD